MLKPQIHHAEHLTDILSKLIETRSVIETCTVERGQHQWRELRIDSQTVTFHCTRHLEFPGWLQATLERDGGYAEYEADLMSVERDNWGGYRVVYEVTGV